jgi:acyl carrier protein
MSATTKAAVYRVISRVLGAPFDQITDESGPDRLENWDSVSHLNLVLALEDEFCISFTDEDVTDMVSVGLIARIVADRAGSAAADGAA